MRFSGSGDDKVRIGDVVIVPTGQTGTLWTLNDDEICVILKNCDLWYGQEYEVRLPSSKKELKACVLNVDRWKGRKV